MKEYLTRGGFVFHHFENGSQRIPYIIRGILMILQYFKQTTAFWPIELLLYTFLSSFCLNRVFKRYMDTDS